MARILYALSGEGHGHVSRVMAMSELLRAQGHELHFCCGGVSEQVLQAKNEPLYAVPALLHVVYRNKLRPYSTFLRNLPHFVQQPFVVDQLVEKLADWKPDLVLNDFEAFSWRAAEKADIPVVAFSPQQILSHLPRNWQHEPFSSYAKISANYIQPRNAILEIIPTYFKTEISIPEKTVFVPPIIRPEIQLLDPTNDGHILVYLNQQAGTKTWIQHLLQLKSYQFIVYGFGQEEKKEANIHFKPHSLQTFLTDLASCRAVICTAGFTLISEALFLQKPILAIPNKGQYEQWLNAYFLEKQQLGRVSFKAIPTKSEISQFLQEAQIHSTQPFPIGNTEALSWIKKYVPS